METTQIQVAMGLSFLFMVLIPIPAILVALLVKQGALKAELSPLTSRTLFYALLTFFGLYYAYVIVGSWLDWYTELMIPPKIMLITALPLLAAYFVFGSSRLGRTVLSHIPIYQLVGVHTFRLVGSFFLWLMLAGYLPPVMGWVAGCGDVLIALSAIPLALSIRKNGSKVRRWLWVWNTLGLADIIITSAMAVYFTQEAILTGTNAIVILTRIPYCLIPAFAPATIIFLHFLIYRRLFSGNF